MIDIRDLCLVKKIGFYSDFLFGNKNSKVLL